MKFNERMKVIMKNMKKTKRGRTQREQRRGQRVFHERDRERRQ